VWITNPKSCKWVGEYCTHADSCYLCLHRSGGGCGWCHGESSCAAGTQNGELSMSSKPNMCNRSGSWIFGDWARYMDHGIWENPCDNLPNLHTTASPRTSESSGSSASNLRASKDSSNGPPNAMGGGNDSSVSSQLIATCIAAMFSVMVLTAFFFMKLRRPHSWTPGPNIAPPHDAQSHQRSGSVVRGLGVNLEALEQSEPGCRPMVIGKSHLEQAKCGNIIDDTLSVQSIAPCAVCLAALEEGEEARRLPCQHFFHRECIDSWLSKSCHCPVCRDVVDKQSARSSDDSTI